MDSDDPESIKETVEKILDLTSKAVQLIEKHYGADDSEEKNENM